ncbi:IS630 family transposase, partial [Candidatus Poribacteria bacterium]|nr:IS630 family transposase [Candidatus Poribacteria bacterium]
MKLEIVESICPETVRQTLKKNELKPHFVKQWVIPPTENAEFVAAMEGVLDLYQKPLDTNVPAVNMDEQPVMLRDDVRDLCPAKCGQVKRVDYEYKRNDTASLFLFTEALSGWRQVSMRERRTAVEARSLCARLEIVYTPKHDSWLNVAEIELSVLTRQCLSRRIPDIETLRRETK